MSALGIRKVVAILGPLLGSLLLWSAQIGPNEAVENWGKWANLFGISIPKWLSGSSLAVWVAILAILAILSGFAAIVKWVRQPQLTDGQKLRLAECIKDFERISQTILIVRPGGDADAQALAFQFRNFFSQYTSVIPTLDYILPERGQTGIMVAVQDVDHPPEAAKSLLDALKNAGINTKITRMPRDTYQSQYVLFIGTQ